MAHEHKIHLYSVTHADGRRAAFDDLADQLDRWSLDGWLLVDTFSTIGTNDEPPGESELIGVIMRRELSPSD